MVDVGQQEVASCEQGLHFAIGLLAFVLARATSLDTRLVEQPRRHRSGAVEHGRSLGTCIVHHRIGLGPRLGHRRIGSSLGEQQRSADDLGIVSSGYHCGSRVDVGFALLGGLLRDLLKLGHGGTSACFHCSRLILGCLDGAGDVVFEGVDVGGVVALPDGLEGCTAHRLGTQIHDSDTRHRSSPLGSPTRISRNRRRRTRTAEERAA